MSLLYILLAMVAAAGVGAGLYLLLRHLRRRGILASLKLSLYLVKVPREAGREGAPARDFKQEINLSEQLLNNLAALKSPFVLEVVVPHVGEEIRFYLAVPRRLGEVAVKQVQALWNGAIVESAEEDYTIFNPVGASAGAYLAQKENPALPVRTYAEIGADTFASIVGAFANLNEVGEGAALQIVARPAGNDPKKRFAGYVRALRRGEPLEKVFGHSSPALSALGEVFSPPAKEERKPEKVVDEDALKALDAKAGKPLYFVNVRLLASAGSPLEANDILEGLAAGFSQFAAPRRNEFRIVKPRNPKSVIYDFSFRNFNPSQAMTLSSEEIASFWHLPISSTETPRVHWLKAKEAPPPPNLPARGVLIGESSFRGERKPVAIGDDDRRRHLYLIGQTGTGKSTLLGNMVIQDVRAGKGLALIDPHGDLVENVLGHIPSERSEDVIYFDPGDVWQPLGLNMLDYNPDRPEEKTFIVNEMQGIFNKLFSQETMGPMFEQYMRNALLLLMEDMPNEPSTLIEVPRVFTDGEYRKRKLARIRNPVVIDFWEKEAVKAGGEASLANITPYITSKFSNFISNDYLRPIIGQPRSALNFREAMDQGKIILINLSKGRIGDINANLLGMIMTGKMLMAALSRVDIPDVNKRRDFYLYIDEFQNFTTDSIATILSEARKYRLSLVMAHQFVGQLAETVKSAVFGNVGSQIVFRVGVEDAEFLVKQFEPVFNQSDLMSIDNLNAYVKVLINGETSKPFNVRVGTESWISGDRAAADRLKEHSRQKYGVARETVEDQIYKRLRE